MKSKWAITIAAVLLLFIGIHYIAAEILSQRIEIAIDEEFEEGTVTVTLNDVSVHPFRGNIAFSNVNLDRSSPPYTLRLKTLSSDLTYWQLWSVFLKETSTFIESLESIEFSGRQLEITYSSYLLGATRTNITIQPIEGGQITADGKASPFVPYSRNASIDLEMSQITVDAPTPHSSTADSLVSSPYRLEKLLVNAEWDGEQETVKLRDVNIRSPKLSGEAAGTFSVTNGFASTRATSIHFLLTYSTSFTVNLGPDRGSFTGNNLTWQRQKSADKSYYNILTALISGEHILTLDQFKWTPSEEVRNQLKAYTGGIAPANKSMRGDSLQLKYHYNTNTRILDIPTLSYETPNYSVSGRGTLTITPKRPEQSYIRNAEIKIYNLSDDLTTSLKQIEDMFGMQIIDSADESIRLHLEGKLQQPQWKLL